MEACETEVDLIASRILKLALQAENTPTECLNTVPEFGGLTTLKPRKVNKWVFIEERQEVHEAMQLEVLEEVDLLLSANVNDSKKWYSPW